jgi:hypothetical protein
VDKTSIIKNELIEMISNNQRPKDHRYIGYRKTAMRKKTTLIGSESFAEFERDMIL